ncbi:hypothetical protein EV356DRAFT_327077 [Viridothelium virens]|uniref:Uncharacterized protein n=1 Tax=Viridothelium virens TaxID=1048519 RepID=A0A6A6GYZ7_VIRVR|nr:hypothetical protein EV356DRAFT_327077 [Viridothelium virens]
MRVCSELSSLSIHSFSTTAFPLAGVAARRARCRLALCEVRSRSSRCEMVEASVQRPRLLLLRDALSVTRLVHYK